MSTHTPGPWRYEKQRNGMCVIQAENLYGPDKHQGLAWTVGLYYPADEANARLIAAAPELLEALQNCVNLLREVHSMLDPEKIGNETLEDWLKGAKTAIAKTEG